ncbi:hypothetical protein OROGR_032966 [Orobanche gracilis]
MRHDLDLKRKNPWLRESVWDDEWEFNPDNHTPDVLYYMKHLCLKRPKFAVREENVFLDIHTKKAALMTSSSVVALLSYTGEQELTQCSGVIIENDDNNGHIILTSANLIRRPTEGEIMEDNLADTLKVIIYLYDGASHVGEVLAYDFHYNIAWIRFQSNSSLSVARLRQVDDCINVNPAEEKAFHLRPHSSHFNLVPGHAIVAVGRYFAKPWPLPVNSVLVAAILTVRSFSWGLARSQKSGEGGPLINLSGEVIGITFYESGCTPFMPVNIALKCWEHYKRYGGLRRPSLGFVATNFYAADLYLMEKVIQKFPSICNGVLVEKVIQGSSADSAGLHFNDVIVQCDGETVRSFLEIYGVDVGYVIRELHQNDPIYVNMVVDEVAVEKFNRWPAKRMMFGRK